MAIRVCQFITELRPAGAERCVYELATRLPGERFVVEVLALRGGAVEQSLRQAGVPVHVLGVAGKLDVRKLPGLVRILRQGRFDILHTHLFHADLVGRPAGKLAKVPHLVHSVHVAEHRFRPWQFAWAGLTDWACDRTVCVSAGVRDHHSRRSGLSPGRYVVIHNGIDTVRYQPDPSRRQELRRQWGVAGDEVLCVFVGRLDEQKGIPELLDSFAVAGRGNPRLKLVLAGQGPLEELVRWRIEQAGLAGRARLLGFTQDVPGVLSAGDIFLQPSRWEGFCLAAAEAMAAGLPVVGTDVAGLNEVVSAGQTGILCPVGDVPALSATILRLADDKGFRAALGLAGMQRVKERFSVERFVARHAELYEAVMAGR